MCCVRGFYIVFSSAFPSAIAGSACLGNASDATGGLWPGFASACSTSLLPPGFVLCGKPLLLGLGFGWEFPLGSSLPLLHLLLLSPFVLFCLLLPTRCAFGWCLFFPPRLAFQPSLFGLVLPGLPLSSPPFCRCGRCHSFLLLRPLPLLFFLSLSPYLHFELWSLRRPCAPLLTSCAM